MNFTKVFCIAIEATTVTHNEVIQNIVASIRPIFRKRGCKLTHENVKLKLVEDGKYVYPDIMVSCDGDDKNAIYIIHHPSLVVEVLSKSISDYDKGAKFNFYQNIPSVQYYMLVESRWQSVELYSRTEKKNIWTYQQFTEPSEIIEFPKLDFQLTFEEIYQDLDLPKRFSYLLGELEDME